MDYSRMTFGECFREAIRLSGRPVYQIERMCGVNVSYIFKIKRGERFPENKQVILKVLNAIQCTGKVREQVMAAYYREQLERRSGREAWECVLELKKIFENQLRLKAAYSGEKCQGELPDQNMIYGKDNIVKTLFYLAQNAQAKHAQVQMAQAQFAQAKDSMEEQAAECEKNVKIRVCGGESNEYLAEFLASVLEEGRTEILHQISYEKAGEDGFRAENIAVLRRFMPCVLIGKGYIPRFTIENKYQDELGELFSCIIIFQDIAVCLTAQDWAFVIRSREQVSYLSRKFEERFERCEQMLQIWEEGSVIRRLSLTEDIFAIGIGKDKDYLIVKREDRSEVFFNPRIPGVSAALHEFFLYSCE